VQDQPVVEGKLEELGNLRTFPETGGVTLFSKFSFFYHFLWFWGFKIPVIHKRVVRIMEIIFYRLKTGTQCNNGTEHQKIDSLRNSITLLSM
jgi:hypothetical protein